MQFSKHPKELEQALQPELFDEIQNALETATKQGTHWATQDLLAAFDDFSADIAACPVPILVIHSDQNHIYPIDAVRDLVRDHCDQMTLVEVKGTGFTLVTSHVDMILREIDTFSPKK